MPTIVVPSPEAWPEFWTGFSVFAAIALGGIIASTVLAIRDARRGRGNWPQGPTS